jgi:hypothetical protein
VRAAPAHAFDDGFKRYIDLKHVIQLDAGRLHGISLRDGARKAVKQEPFGTVGLGNALLDQIDDQVVADQGARVHDFFGFNAQLRAGFDSRTEHIASGNLGNTVLLADEGRLRPLARARRAQQYQSHGCPLIL